MPVQYESIVAEHEATRQAAGLFDVSHMGRLFIEGPRAVDWLEGLLTRSVRDLAVGRSRYTLLPGVDLTADETSDAAVILDDAVVTRLPDAAEAAPRLLLVVNASNRPRVVRWLESQLPDAGVAVDDRTAATAMIAVQGPRVFAGTGSLLLSIWSAAEVADLAALPNYGAIETVLGGAPAIVSRTGYTGEDGLELVVDAAAAIPLWEQLLAAGQSVGVRPCGLGSRDTLRLEAGMPLYGHELTETSDPFAIGLDRAVDLDGRSFPGRAELVARRLGGPRRVGLQFGSKRAARQGDLVRLPEAEQACGIVTSGSFSPTCGCGIALAMVEPDAATIGTELEAVVRGSHLPARVVSLPFYRRPREAA